jgi:peptidoglycan hydrolase CwlO-like protein
MKAIISVVSASALLSKSKVTPVEKVTELLIKLKEKTIADKAKEKAMFIKFDDYCHSQEDEKFWRAAKGASKVDRLDREIENHQAQIDKKLLQIDELDTEIKGNRETIQSQTDDMHATLKTDAAAIKDLDTVISQCKRALTHLQNSDVSGTGLVQLADMLEASLKLQKPPKDIKNLIELLEMNEPGQPHAYKFHSTKVIEILEDLLKQFKDQRRDRDVQALQSRRDSEHSISALENLTDSQVHKRDEFQGEVDQHKQEMEEKKQDRALTDKNLFADVDFAHHLVGCDQVKSLADTEGKEKLTEYLPRNLDEAGGCPSEIGECGEKRKNYAARVKTRDEELAALDKAIELMQGEGGSSYKANRRLTALPQVPHHLERQASIKKHVVAIQKDNDDDDLDADDDDEDDDDEINTNFLQMSHSHRRLKDLVQKN